MTSNLYPNRCNPCGLCMEEKEKCKGNMTQEEDLVDFTLEGNDTTLVVKERSTTKIKNEGVKDTNVDPRLKVARSKELKPVDLNPPESKSPEVETSVLSNSHLISQHKSNTDAAKSEKDEGTGLGFSRGLKPYKKRYSGNTYFEETLRHIRLEEYWRDLQEAEKKRKLWKSFQKEIEGERRLNLIKNGGPGWWQEPSRKQICLAMTLEAVINADYEEAVTGRTRQWLLDLGVTTRLTPKQVRGCMKRSLLDPIDFLLETHCVILKLQLNVKKNKGNLQQPFSLNERLLLSALCVLHLPTLLIMLHYMLPPPKPFSTSKHIQELLFGDLNDDRIRYESPYMEPLPFRSGKHFHDWAFNKVFRALFPAIYEGLKEELRSDIKQPKTMRLVQKTIMNEAKHHFQPKNYTMKSSIGNVSMTDSVTWLITKCVTNRGVSLSMKPYDGEENEHRKTFFSRQLTRRLTGNRSTFSSTIQSLKETMEGDNVALGTSLTDNDNNPQNLHTDGDKSSSLGDEENKFKESLQYSETRGEGVTEDAFPNKVRLSLKPLTETKNTKFSSFESKEVEEEPEINVASNHNDFGEETVKHFDKLPVPECEELNEIWNEIRDMPEKDQLKHAIEILAGMGDPLAQLPLLHTIPTVKRWFEIRRGKHRVLSKSVKQELITNSRGMWKLPPAGFTKEGPKVKCSKKTERLLTWDKKKWLESQVKTEMNNYFTRVKQEKVDNARLFFPSMLNHYDHGSRLNRNFRDVFYAYLPAREADTFAFRPL